MRAALALLALVLPARAGELFVSAQADPALVADGTRARPFRSLTAALAAARARGWAAEVRLDVGRYDAAHGERFPLELAPGTVIAGAGSPACVLDGGGAVLLLRARGAGAFVLGGLTLSGAGIALAVEAPPAPSTQLGLDLSDLAVTGATTGLELDLGTRELWLGTLILRADGLRATDCGTGLAVRGEAPLELNLTDSLFERCGVGLLLEADPDEDGSKLGAPDAPRYKRVHHQVELARTTFLACRESGFRRRGADGKNDGLGYRFSDCLFQENDTGIEFVRPSADSSFMIERSRFLANTRHGLLATGLAGDPERFRLVTDSLFRWNGIGIHATCVNLELDRCRVQSNLGNGIFTANFLAEPTTTRVKNSLLTGNGASGLYGLADARLLTVELVHCTIAANAATGVYDKKRHAGKSQYALRGCIVAGNGEDLHGLEQEQVFDSWIASFGDAGRGDPGFLAAAAGDFTLAPESPCRGAGTAESAALAGPLDLAGMSRPAESVDLGAFIGLHHPRPR
ncbi:MAG: right-handed parallel beta-helix repeat-containing protein [Planctomycetota bacterium]